MRTLVVGAGAMGGYACAVLARAGANVVLLGRGERGEAIKTGGLRVKSAVHPEFTVRPRVVGSLADSASCESAPFDLVIIAVKTAALRPLAGELGNMAGALLGETGVVLPLVNGLGVEKVLAESLGAARVVGAVADFAVEVVAPGELFHSTGEGIQIAALEPSGESRLQPISTFLRANGLACAVRPSLPTIRWRKMVWNCAINAVTALTRLTMGQAAAHAGLRPLLEASMRESLAVAAADGVQLPERLIEVMLHAGVACQQTRTSTQLDVAAGRESECMALNGAISALGRQHGIPTPINDTLCTLLQGQLVLPGGIVKGGR